MPAVQKPISTLDLTGLLPDQTAIFLDFDGTLAAIKEHPDDVSVPSATIETLTQLSGLTGGAIAIITGRPISDIDRFLNPLRLPTAGVHGLERRNVEGERIDIPFQQDALDQATASLMPFVNANAGLLLETKRGSIALHFRRRPDLEKHSTRVVKDVLEQHPGLHVLPGKMVLEIKGGDASKADAIAAFLTEAPFINRRPVFAGDDVTDELAFPLINRMDGISIKIGEGATVASHNSPDTASFAQWLEHLTDHFRR